MHTARSSSCWGGWPDPPQLPPWVWGWTWSPSISPLCVGLDLIPLNFPLGVSLDLIPLNFPLGVGLDLIPLNFPLGCGPGPDPLNFPLGVGLDLIPLNFPFECGPGAPPEQAPPRTRSPSPQDQAPLGPDPLDQATPPPRGQNSWHTLPKILLCPKLRLGAVKITHLFQYILPLLFSDYFHILTV